MHHFARLADALAGATTATPGQPPIDQPLRLDASPEPVVERWPRPEQVEPRVEHELAVVERVRDGVRGWEMTFAQLPLRFTADRSLFAVQVLAGQGVLDDDRGSSIELRELPEDKQWRVRWIPELEPDDPRCGQPLRLAIRGRVELTSRSFVPACPSGEPE